MSASQSITTNLEGMLSVQATNLEDFSAKFSRLQVGQFVTYKVFCYIVLLYCSITKRLKRERLTTIRQMLDEIVHSGLSSFVAG